MRKASRAWRWSMRTGNQSPGYSKSKSRQLLTNKAEGNRGVLLLVIFSDRAMNLSGVAFPDGVFLDAGLVRRVEFAANEERSLEVMPGVLQPPLSTKDG